jgi:cystathionine beta-synthase
VSEAIRLMREREFSQIPISLDGRIVGSLSESHVFDVLVRDPDVKDEPVDAIMQPAFPFVDVSTPLELLATMITVENPAVLVRDFKTEKTHIITRSDVIRALA